MILENIHDIQPELPRIIMILLSKYCNGSTDSGFWLNRAAILVMCLFERVRA